MAHITVDIVRHVTQADNDATPPRKGEIIGLFAPSTNEMLLTTEGKKKYVAAMQPTSTNNMGIEKYRDVLNLPDKSAGEKDKDLKTHNVRILTEDGRTAVAAYLRTVDAKFTLT